MNKERLIELANQRDDFGNPKAFQISFWAEDGLERDFQKAVFCISLEKKKVKKQDLNGYFKIKDLTTDEIKTVHSWTITAVNHQEYHGL